MKPLYLNQVITPNATLRMESGDRITLVGPLGNKVTILVIHDEITVDTDSGHQLLPTGSTVPGAMMPLG